MSSIFVFVDGCVDTLPVLGSAPRFCFSKSSELSTSAFRKIGTISRCRPCITGFVARHRTFSKNLVRNKLVPLYLLSEPLLLKQKLHSRNLSLFSRVCTLSSRKPVCFFSAAPTGVLDSRVVFGCLRRHRHFLKALVAETCICYHFVS